ncbi:chorismate synthase [Campylobacter sp. VicNov18]|uniref:chorismate synthase n=1 Tax=Campylobacter bilis TaxID=2691918 RepID=UPI00130DD384|nr:chorismate synthase [Campylobacter bilis]MPV63756.1 chorismate synthase [Campylobacter hepaticus]MBM0637257.1 chorismate synthase [Campylobacter bilis]MCC8277976.1 chorismate synthase [Campylobacter bilis]MCC8299480.1 chorismate synthase [Campylobacter bilis]MCC8300885.1 chorismate synthase [Campylobacter bilis]
MNTFGTRLKFTSFGESHGRAIGCVIDGMPAGLEFDEDFLQSELDKRRGGSRFTTPRKESDKAEVLSGVFEGYTTGHPIAIMVYNENTHVKDYNNLKDLFRPAHADFTYFYKYGLRDYRGGGRSSARESVARVAAGAICAMLLKEFGISVQSGVFGIGGVVSNLEEEQWDFEFAEKSEIFCLDPSLENEFKNEILNARNSKDSVGAAVFTKASGMLVGLGEVLYDKLDSKLAHALMGINGVKAVEIGEGINASKLRGSKNNDILRNIKFLTNHSGGILGGISNGENLILKTYFKPTPSIFLKQESMDKFGNNLEFQLKGRHDPCIGIRGSVVANAMVRLVLADCLLLNASANLKNLKKAYGLE